MLAYFTMEALFAIAYRIMAFQIGRRRPPTDYDAKFLRNTVKNVLESNMSSSASSPSATPMTSALSSRRGSLEPRARRKLRFGSVSSDSGYGSSSSDRGNASGSDSEERLPVPIGALVEEPEIASNYNFLSPKLAADDPRAVDFREASRHWFHGADFSSICRTQVEQWMSWSLYGQPLEEVVRERRQSVSQGVKIDKLPQNENIGRDKLETVEHSVDLWEARAGTKLRRGSNPAVDVLRLTLDPVRVLARPLSFYVVVWCAQQFYNFRLAQRGFVEETHGGLRWLVRTPAGWIADETDESTRPFVFLHGLGLGPVQYAPFLNKITQDKDFEKRPIAILIQPHLSMSIFDSAYLNPPEAKTCARAFRVMALARGFAKCGTTVLSHSNGTIVHGWLLKNEPDLVKRSCLIDPVAFILWEPTLPYNFLYTAARSPMQYLMRYFVARELGVANTLQRRFDWISSLLRPCEIPGKGDPRLASVFLSERDAIVDTPRVASYLTGEGMGEGEGMTVFPKQKHGDAMLGIGKPFEQVMAWCRNDA